MKSMVAISAVLIAGASSLAAQDTALPPATSNDPVLQQAQASGICGNNLVAAARFDAEASTIFVTCSEDDDVVGFVPVIGGLAGPILAGAAVALAAIAGGGGPADTVSVTQ